LIAGQFTVIRSVQRIHPSRCAHPRVSLMMLGCGNATFRAQYRTYRAAHLQQRGVTPQRGGAFSRSQATPMLDSARRCRPRPVRAESLRHARCRSPRPVLALSVRCAWRFFESPVPWRKFYDSSSSAMRIPGDCPSRRGCLRVHRLRRRHRSGPRYAGEKNTFILGSPSAPSARPQSARDEDAVATAPGFGVQSLGRRREPRASALKCAVP